MMREKRKSWIAVSSAIGASMVISQGAVAATSPHTSLAPATLLTAPGPMMEGEGEGAVSVDLTTNDSAFLAQLGLIRGHLWVGMKLYEQGHLEMAKTHMKHPGDELYAGLVSAFEARDLPGFAKPLSDLADSVNNDADKAVVMENYAALKDAIAANEPLASMTAAEVLKSIASMLLTSADEYAIGIKQNQVVNVHEFQDAYGFQQIALSRLDALSEAQRAGAEEAIAETRKVIQGLDELWPTTTPEGELEGDASLIYGAASRIEMEANGI
ncbi:hypothetical protein [Idiomarina sp. MD25a]|uniref:hypothetical protein n=1 Tax=Idiomarina sp. MD25a TaxID=1889913 RepID=UPI00209B5A19|nr:hypothetical protein [Idiomarina sp. MD25a]